MTTNATMIGTGVRVRVVLIDPPFAYGRQAVVQSANGDQARVPLSALKLDPR